eukprot:6175103-Pleurochrysis_carterae.AAC.4
MSPRPARPPSWLQSQLVPGVCAATASPPVFSRKSPNWRAPDVGGGGDTRARRSAALAPLPKAKAECARSAHAPHTLRTRSAHAPHAKRGMRRTPHAALTLARALANALCECTDTT